MRLVRIRGVGFFVDVFHHVLRDTLRDAQWIYLFWSFVLDIRNEKGSFDLLVVEILRINTPALLEVSVELRLPRYLSLVDLLVPKWMLPQVLPVYSLYGILLEQSL